MKNVITLEIVRVLFMFFNQHYFALALNELNLNMNCQ